MTSLDIKINIREFSNYSAALGRNSDKKTKLMIVESFSYYILRFYLRLIEEAIYSRRYQGQWEPIDEQGYIDYLGVVPTNDILSLIKDALEVEKIGYNFIVRINPHYKYPGTNIPLVRVLRAIETGTSEFPARPILAKITSKVRRRLFDLWRGYLTMKGVI